MIRTQIYLTQEEKEKLMALSGVTGKKQAELVREAVDQYIVKTSQARKMLIIDQAAGMWADRDDLPDFEKIRNSVDREWPDE